MMTIGKVRLGELQKEYSDRLLSVLTVLLVLMMFVVVPLQAGGVYILGIELFGVIVGLVVVAAALVISASPTTTAIMLAAFSLNIVVVVARLVKPLACDLYVVAAAWFVIVITLGFAVVRPPSRQLSANCRGRPALSADRAGVCVPVHACRASGAERLYGSERQTENGKRLDLFQLCHADVDRLPRDIYPVHPTARSLRTIETIIGQLYPATLLARLASLEIEGRRR